MPRKTDQWRERQTAIAELLAALTVRSQTDLVGPLAARGFPVTQSSVSRDLKEMHVVKLDGRYVLSASLSPGDAPAAGAETRIITQFVKRWQTAGPHQLVVHTEAGGASSVAVAIDHASWPEVVGTVAGDDTVFVATASRRDQLSLEARLSELTKETAHA